ncbi:MAG: DUF502 domain-containing protein [Thiohalobacteraceae bacterium]
MMRAISRNILTGLITILPVVLTLYLFYWLVVSAEAALGTLLKTVLPMGAYWPGMGVAIGLLAAFVVGLLMRALAVRRLFALGERIFTRLPLIKSVYSALRDLMDYFSPERKKDFGQVVAVTLGEMQLIGFVTQADTGRLPTEFHGQDRVLVYLPMSYQIGGYAVFVPRSAVRPLDMGMEEAMRFVITAGVTGDPTRDPQVRH